MISEFELRQLEAEAAAVRAQLPPLELARDQQEAALAVLLGRSPAQIFDAGVKMWRGRAPGNGANNTLGLTFGFIAAQTLAQAE